MIIGRDLLGKLGIILNFNDKTVTWDTDTIPIKERGSLNSQKVITEINLTANEPQSLLNEFSRSTKILDAEYKPAILEEVIKTCETSIKRNNTNYSKYSKNMNIFLMEHLENSTWLP
jgi:hypothetical protein